MIKPIFKKHRANFIILVSLILSLILINPASAQTTWHERTATDPISAGCGAPYALAGDDGAGDYYAWTPANGAYTVTATPYSGPDATGIAGTALSINFTVTHSTPNPEITGPQRAWP